MASSASEIAELRMVAVNISAMQQQHYTKLETFVSAQMGDVHASFAQFNSRLDAFLSDIASGDARLAAALAECGALRAERDSLQARLDAAQAQASTTPLLGVTPEASAVIDLPLEANKGTAV
jgi:hypothetical protein